MDTFEPIKHLVIDDLKTLQVLAHPLRSQILDAFSVEPLTVKQVARKLGLSPNKLYYHVNMLEEHGLLTMVETRTVGNMIEKLYRTAAERFDLHASMLTFAPDAEREQIEQMVVAPLDATRQDLLRSIKARRLTRAQGVELEPRTISLNRCISRLTDEQAEDFRARLLALVEEFGKADLDLDKNEAPGEDTEHYALTVAYYTTVDFTDEADGDG